MGKSTFRGGERVIKSRPHRLPQVLSADEQTALLRQIHNPRDRLVVRLMLATGLRASELAGLRRDNLEPKEGCLRVIGKGDYERILWVPLPLLREMRAYMKKHPGEHIFNTRNSTPVCTSYLRQLFALAGRRAGIPRRIHPHMLRHTFATELYTRTKNIRLVQRALGHAHIGTTEIYTYVADTDVREAMQGKK